MNFDTKAWLPHLIESVPIEARKNRTSMYTIALEGWRRGLHLKFFNLKEYDKLQIRYSLSHKGNERYFDGSSGDMVSKKAFDICENKGLTNKYLSNAGVPIPQGKEFNDTATDEEIISYAKSIGYPLVLKPTNGSGGKGVIVNIKTLNEFKTALDHVRNKLNFKEVIVEEYVTGNEVRVYILDNKVLGAVNRRPASVVGDGEQTIRSLVSLKNEHRKKIPHLYFRPIRIDKYTHELLHAQGYTIDSKPKKGERVYLKKVSNISLGGDPIDVTENLTPTQKEVAIRAAAAIPGLKQCGVDMIIDERTKKPVILEVNTRPGIGSHLFPVEGTAKDIPKEIIDYYFPETKGIETRNSNIYFDFRSIIEPLRGRSTLEVEVKPISSQRIYSKQFKITGSIQFDRLFLYAKKIAARLELNGFVKKENNSEITIVIGTNEISKLNEFKKNIEKGIHGDYQIIEKTWDRPVKLGFHLDDDLNSLSLRELEEKLRELERKYDSIEKEQRRLKHRIKLMEQSRSWKVTETIRNLLSKLKIMNAV